MTYSGSDSAMRYADSVYGITASITRQGPSGCRQPPLIAGIARGAFAAILHWHRQAKQTFVAKQPATHGALGAWREAIGCSAASSRDGRLTSGTAASGRQLSLLVSFAIRGSAPGWRLVAVARHAAVHRCLPWPATGAGLTCG